MTILLVAVAVAFAVSMGAHYTGACMGMPHALGAVSSRAALWIMAPLTLLGAALASHGVQHTVGFDLVTRPLTVVAAVIVLGVAFALTSLFNVLRIPSSTIQILVFSVAGAALAGHAGVRWGTIVTLAVVWVIAPPVAAVVGFAATRALDRVPGIRPLTTVTGSAAAVAAAVPAVPAATDAESATGAESGPATLRGAAMVGVALTAVGAAASFTMGANDVANAAGSLVGTGTFTALTAGAVCGAGLAVGVLTWGRPLLRKVAFDIVTVDRPMATAAQLVQAVVVLCAVAFGLFTSMNQALVGAMAGAGMARGRHAVKTASLYGILRGWLIGPAAGIAAAYLITLAVGAAGVAVA
ncbi:MAG: inorganic phosphate transporter [Actinobacteria bacterium 69-20]|nr:inorganic phosphate transporter [Actinomycetota bacterium]OJV24667.1 MAG: inorganic phosphate transporter [Actinobacteria bacterium 69-20]